MRAPIPVRVEVRGLDGHAVAWLRQFTARENTRWNRAYREAVRDAETADERIVELCMSELAGRIDRVEVSGDWPEFPEEREARLRWLDEAGGPVVDALTLALIPQVEEQELGKSRSGAH